MNAIDTKVFDNLGLSKTATAAVVGDKDKLGQKDFLKLMTTQLMNQDPMKPMENGDFLGQIAQFGTVSGIEDLQASFSALSGALTSNQAMQASSLVGKTVAIPSETALFNAGGNLSGTFELAGNSTNTFFRVQDASGQLIRTVDMGQQAAGDINFSWDGLKDDGTYAKSGFYKVSVDANVGGATEAAKMYTNSIVESVNVGSIGEPLVLNVMGVGRINFSDVKQILQ